MTQTTAVKKILMVCTGNTCRSPMAEALMRSELQRRGLASRVAVSSCGTGTRDGIPASSESVFVMRNREIDISSHRSRKLRADFLKEADVVIAMHPNHADELLAENPDVKPKLSVWNIADPIGMSIRIYDETLNSVHSALQKTWPEISKKLGVS